jgi:hypothetical protein
MLNTGRHEGFRLASKYLSKLRYNKTKMCALIEEEYLFRPSQETPSSTRQRKPVTPKAKKEVKPWEKPDSDGN